MVRMQGVLTRLQRELGITFVYVTHRQSEAFAMSDRVVIMNEGRIEQLDSPRGIYRSPATRFGARIRRLEQYSPGNGHHSGRDGRARNRYRTLSMHPGRGTALPVGSPASLVVSADLIRLTTAPAVNPRDRVPLYQ
ncbi:MAG: hypothetical protein Ct9H300mP16_03200 [Pseudomonadota bacterium]|nr:MAG: hypothetical protein Ct9H300mP16_03200 [Pseudomonadota bacterium]